MNVGPGLRGFRLATLLLVVTVCFWRLGDAPLLETDEGFAANRAASMLRHHTWRLSYDDYGTDDPQFHKPPLLYWAIALCYRASGLHVGSARLPVALSAFALCGLLYLINRRHFGEPVALAATVLFCAIPFVQLHMRTAMLEMPLQACVIGAVYLLAYAPDRRGSAAGAGLCAAAALLTKGLAGSLALAVAVVHALVLNGPRAATWRRIAAAAATALALFAVYLFIVVPAGWRDEMLRALFVREGVNRTVSDHLGPRAAQAAAVLWDQLGPLLGAAAVALAVLPFALRRRVSPPDGRLWRVGAWFALFACVAVPVLVVGARQTVPYARYFLPVYPFVATLAALGLVALLRRWPDAVPAAVVALAVGCAVPARAWAQHPWKYLPVDGMAAMAAEAARYVPEDGKLIYCAGRGKCHQALFHSQRALVSLEDWLRDDFRPGATAHALVVRGNLPSLPLVRATELASTGWVSVVRLEIATNRPEIAGMVLASSRRAAATAESLRAQGRAIEPFEGGFYLLRQSL